MNDCKERFRYTKYLENTRYKAFFLSIFFQFSFSNHKHFQIDKMLSPYNRSRLPMGDIGETPLVSNPGMLSPYGTGEACARRGKGDS